MIPSPSEGFSVEDVASRDDNSLWASHLRNAISHEALSHVTLPITSDESARSSYPLPNVSKDSKCSCVACLRLGTKTWGLYKTHCHVSGCSTIYDYGADKVKEHERSHFLKADKYGCLEDDCRAVLTKWGDLKRHYKSQHCTNRRKYACPIIGCRYGGDNGFPRKDKLKSHFKNVHEGKGHGTLGPEFETRGEAARRRRG